VSGIKTAVARDAELLLFNMVPPTRVGDYFACGIFYMFRLNCKSLSIERRRLRLLAFVNIASDNFMLSIC